MTYDAIRELAENLRNSGREWVHAATVANNITGVLDAEPVFVGEPDFVGAVAAIRALHRPTKYTQSGTPDFECCHHCTLFASAGGLVVKHPCPTGQALDKAGCP